jgi:hypothetical protein
MCTILLRINPDASWPVQLAFVRDEDRSRPTDPPAAWWPHLPSVIGGRDARAGGTWLAVDATDRPAVAMLVDQYDPAAHAPDPAHSPTRGTLPLVALERGDAFDPRRDLPGRFSDYQPYHLVVVRATHDGWSSERWGWSGSELDHEVLGPGDHVLASRAATVPGEPQRRARLLDRLAALRLEWVDLYEPTLQAWGPWPRLLDARGVTADDLGEVAIHSISRHPGFGTVGASLVALSATAQVRYDVNPTTTVDPAGWQQVALAGTQQK